MTDRIAYVLMEVDWEYSVILGIYDNMEAAEAHERKEGKDLTEHGPCLVIETHPIKSTYTEEDLERIE